MRQHISSFFRKRVCRVEINIWSGRVESSQANRLDEGVTNENRARNCNTSTQSRLWNRWRNVCSFPLVGETENNQDSTLGSDFRVWPEADRNGEESSRSMTVHEQRSLRFFISSVDGPTNFYPHWTLCITIIYSYAVPYKYWTDILSHAFFVRYESRH